MPDLVGCRFRYVFLVVRAELLREDPGRAIGKVVGVIEDANVGDTSRTGGIPVRRADNHAHAVIDIAGAVNSKPVHAGVLRRDVDVERRVILRNPLPYVLDFVHLRIVET